MKQQINEIKRMQRIAGLITENEYQESLAEEQSSPKIYGRVLFELLASYNEFIGGYDEDIYEICDKATSKIAQDKWYSVNDVVNLDSKNKNIICGGTLAFAFSMDAKRNISNNYFKYYITQGIKDTRIKGNIIDTVEKGFFYNLSTKINSNPEEWYLICGEENFDAISGTISTGDLDYKNTDIAKLTTKGKINTIPTPTQMGEDLEIELASLRSKQI